MNDAVVETYEDSDALCGASATPATHALVENLREPSVAENQAFWSWYDEREGAPPASYIRTGQKRRGGCTREAYGDLLITRWWDGSERGAWGDGGGSSCQALLGCRQHGACADRRGLRARSLCATCPVERSV